MPKQSAEQPKQKRSTLQTVLTVMAVLCGVLMLSAFGYVGYSVYRVRTAEDDAAEVTAEQTTETTVTTTTTVTLYPLAASRTTETAALSADLVYGSTAALIAVREDGNVLLADRNADAVIYPASMTKIMTMLTYLKLCGAEHLQDTVTMDRELLSYAWQNSASCAGFMEFEEATVEELLYGTMLPSGADAALMLAKLASGSEKAFAAEMNAYAEEMGLAHTHFVNCTGLHDPMHVSTAQDVAIMLGYAIQNELCYRLMSTPEYVTEPNPHHLNGLTLKSTMFNRMSGQELRERYGMPIAVIGGKTGYTDEAGQCLASWAEDDAGNVYLAVVAGCAPKDPYEALADTLTLYMMTQMPLAEMWRYATEPEETTTETTDTTTMTATTQTETTAALPVSSETAPTSAATAAAPLTTTTTIATTVKITTTTTTTTTTTVTIAATTTTATTAAPVTEAETQTGEE